MLARLIALLFFICYSFLISTAQSVQDPDLKSMIHKSAFSYSNGEYSGKGWDLLKAEIAKSQFVMIGEQHGEAEIPVFAGKVAQVFQPKALVIEIDPYTASQLKKVSVDPSKYAAYFRQKPYDFAFYSWETEMALARQMTSSNIDIWGLNEINFLSLPTFFETLAAETKKPGLKKLALKKAATISLHDLPLYKDIAKYSDFSAYSLKEVTVDSMIVAFKNENAASKKMLQDLKRSIPLFANSSYTQRVNLMKKNLLNYLHSDITADAINMPKLLFKFGANHLSRTDEMNTAFEVGNLADNLAGAAVKKTLHILVFGKKGTSNTMAPTDNTLAIQPYDIATDDELKSLLPFSDQVQGEEWALFDFRPIRKAVKAGTLKIEPRLLSFINGYDVLVVFGQVSGSRFIE
ncbi:hypothetical protein FK004_14575 [Flavobacterium kingsejongi]|uniref:Haem-binding uptake Tiki superfamily ChaN domain-containing protein n=2 Tax=Flavobacterium kingsejongi TaxID=1678728 RepID=A0A2S1LRK7_9FLAO|nr:hypothetical protein FK004_14575 [Flavobacterium kingsejongi]